MLEKQIIVTLIENKEKTNFEKIIKVSHPDRCVYDFDGIFCEECPKLNKGSDEAYVNFLHNAKPLYYPEEGYVPAIVTGRHYKYRSITEDWLKKHNIKYGQMVMRNFELNVTDSTELIGSFKASVFKGIDAAMFVESRAKQAKLIHELTAKQTFCPVGEVYFRLS